MDLKIDLKTRKLINNLHKYGNGNEAVRPITIDYESRIPDHFSSRNNNLDYGSLISGVSGLIGTNLNAKYNGSADDIYSASKTYNTSIGGTPVTLRNTDNVYDAVDKEKSKAPYTILSSAAQGAGTGMQLGGGWGATFGAIVGTGLGLATTQNNIYQAEQDARKAKNEIDSSNVYELLSSNTNNLQRMDAEKNSSYYNQFKYGKDSYKNSNLPNGGQPMASVNSAYGKITAVPNAKTQGGKNGEFIWKEGTVFGSKVKGTTKDENLTHLDDEDVVFSSRLKDENGIPLSKLAEYYYNSGNFTGLYQAEKMQKMIHDVQNLTGDKKFDGFYHAKFGKLPKFQNGSPISEWPSYITRGTGVLMDIGRLIEAYKDKPHKPDYSTNTIDYQALRDLKRAKYQFYPIQQQLLNGLYKGNRAIDLSGQPAGVKTSNKIANYANYYNALSDAQMKLQQGNIGLAHTASNAALDSTYKQALVNQDAKYRGDEVWSKNHGKYITNITEPINNMFGQLGALTSDINKIRQGNYMLRLYDQQGKRDDRELAWRIGSSNSNNTNPYIII